MISCLAVVVLLLVTAGADPPTFNNIGYLGRGYNQFTGNPHERGYDPGLKVPIFDTTQYSKNRTTVDGTYKIPDGVDAHKESSCNSESVSKEIMDENDLARILKLHFEANFTGVPFSASGMFQRVQKRCRENRDVFIDSISSCEQYTARILMYEPPSFTKDFESGKANLPTEYTDDTRDIFVKFLEDFGTHVVTKLWMGSKLIKTYGMSETVFAELLGVGFNVKLAATLQTGKIIGKFGASTALERSKEFQSFLAQHMLFEDLSGTPENPPQELLDKWVPMRSGEPAPVRYGLTRISAFVDKSSHDAVEKAISEFCHHIGGQCEPNEPLPPPIPICPSVKFDFNQTRTTGPCTYGVSVVQRAHPKLTCPDDHVLTGIQLSVGNGHGHLLFNVGCSTRFDISLEPGDWVPPVLVSHRGSEPGVVTCPKGYFAIGISFVRNCLSMSLHGPCTYATLKCSRSSQPIKSLGFTQWSSLPMPSSPLYHHLFCDDGGIICGVEFSGEKDGSWPKQHAYRLLCCRVGPKCLAQHRIQNATVDLPPLPTDVTTITIADPKDADQEELFNAMLINDDKRTDFFSSRSLDLGPVQFYSSRFDFDIPSPLASKRHQGFEEQSNWILEES